jgi:hypothetical protein
LRKLIIMTAILLASSGALGCVACNDIWPPFEPTYSPTVASPSATPGATENPSPSTKLIMVETDSPPYQYMPNQARVSHPRYYRTADWEMPVPAKGALTPMSHGVIHELEFWNPTKDNKTISVYNLKSAFYESKDMPHKFIQSYEMFYDDKESVFFSEFTLKPGERRTVLMYAYINDDKKYETYRGYFIEPVSVSLVPTVPYT